MATAYVAHLAPFGGESRRPVVSVTGDGELHPVAPVTAVPPGLVRAWARRPLRVRTVTPVPHAAAFNGVAQAVSEVSIESAPRDYMQALARDYLQDHGYTLAGPPA